ncbi:hypothetical protein QFZ55_007447 [Streptomyces luteogriseus]|nr:hypothetical protein [Streptomyces luteogriseus]
MQPFEDPRLLPAIQTPPAGLPGAEPQLQGQELPGDVLVQDVQDALQAQPVRHRSRPRRPLGPGWQQRFDQRPQVVVHDPRPIRHTHPNAQIITTVTPDQGTSTRSCYELFDDGASAARTMRAGGWRPLSCNTVTFGGRRCCQGAHSSGITSVRRVYFWAVRGRPTHLLRPVVRSRRSVLKRAADAGHDMAFGVGAELAVKCEGLEQAATWSEPFATAGRPFASAAYLGILMEAERSDDALRWCLEPERRVDMAVLHTAAELLVASGREDEALRWLGSLAEQGHAFALWRMAGLFEQLGRVDEAVSCAKKLAKQGNTSALHLTAFLTTRQANGEESISLYRKAILAGEPFAIAEMVDLLKELGCHDEGDRLRKYGLEADGQIAGGAG